MNNSIKLLIVLYCTFFLLKQILVLFIVWLSGSEFFVQNEILHGVIPLGATIITHLDKVACSIWLGLVSRKANVYPGSLLWMMFGLFAGLHAILCFILFYLLQQKAKMGQQL